MDEDTATPIYLTGHDVDGRPITTNLTYSVDTLPQHGTLSRSVGTLHVTAENPIIYLPATNYIGPDSFSYRVTDGTGLAKGATVSINVANVNDIPTISAIPDQLVIEVGYLGAVRERVAKLVPVPGVHHLQQLCWPARSSVPGLRQTDRSCSAILNCSREPNGCGCAVARLKGSDHLASER